ncbi:MAG TPA: transporter substrate-binding domain-containing protein [Alphaproteobacteria bacterium]|nr:transporter substrate-binding domain-containing protein [Alphaproteobacteria bacterium]
MVRGFRHDYPIGLLYSTTGDYAAIGRDALDGALMALDEVNADPAFPFALRPLVENPGGVAERYRARCEDLTRRQGCRHVVGTITSLSRKEVIPVVEKHDALLWYIAPYEGFECCDNVIYLGACPNQHIVPMFHHVLPRHGTRAYLVGSNYIWGWETNRIARELLGQCGGEAVAERYLALGSEDVPRIVAEIAEKRPDFILSTLIGPSSYAFFRAIGALAAEDPAFKAERMPIVNCNLTECELGLIGEAGIGHLSAAVWFADLPEPHDPGFSARARARLGGDRPASAHLVGGYVAVRMLAECIRETGDDTIAAVRPVATGRRFDTPLGPLVVDPRTNHAALTPHLGRIAGPGRFEVVESARGPVAADPYLVDFAPERLAAAVRGARARRMEGG